MIAAPCGTFGCRRNDRGPRRLRGEYAPEIFGVRDLTPEEKQQVRVGTCLASRGLEAAEKIAAQHKPFFFETPKRQPGRASVFKLPQAVALAQKAGVTIQLLVQCMLGAKTTKPT